MLATSSPIYYSLGIEIFNSLEFHYVFKQYMSGQKVTFLVFLSSFTTPEVEQHIEAGFHK